MISVYYDIEPETVTPLYVACYNYRKEIKLLINYGTDINIKNKSETVFFKFCKWNIYSYIKIIN